MPRAWSLSTACRCTSRPTCIPGAAPSDIHFNIVVPKGRLWVMGDNRAISDDSRLRQYRPGRRHDSGEQGDRPGVRHRLAAESLADPADPVDLRPGLASPSPALAPSRGSPPPSERRGTALLGARCGRARRTCRWPPGSAWRGAADLAPAPGEARAWPARLRATPSGARTAMSIVAGEQRAVRWLHAEARLRTERV